ncbi:tetraspanin-15 [Genypterus blacodes]|uniref:tetraspanin-15 n=1 Tax=Genypterus blacodes TaxID=154954 RepID=UPI003F76D092
MADQKDVRYCKKCSYIFLKFILFTYAIVWWVVGGIILATGIYAEVERQRYKTMEGVFLAPAIILIVLGSILFVVSFIGVLGTLRDNITLLKVFMYTLTVCLFLELISGIVALYFRDKSMELLNNHIRRGIENYYDDLDFRNIMDYVQKKFECCGAQAFQDWEVNMYHKCLSHSALSCGVPHSCCIVLDPKAVVNTHCGSNVLNKERLSLVDVIYVRGCTDAFFLWLSDNFSIMAAVLLAILLPQLFGEVVSWLYISRVEDSIREYGDYRDGLLNSNTKEREVKKQGRVAKWCQCLPDID